VRNVDVCAEGQLLTPTVRSALSVCNCTSEFYVFICSLSRNWKATQVLSVPCPWVAMVCCIQVIVWGESLNGWDQK
jgi:hypothetical protein